ncbi:unnamed protein product [Bursaphelenchus okinawaensis]|uniref:MFS domain-containing protein n=1 Tax=Bursaphelenchus okinawaensis TaxID=465554 RepID=A0A811KZ98_9BILA|nr:unnamed protein product [Bursaphelenchus okinawaensis]CAG9114130.1 unnamed protein product [Bursaphelenchus okinawaensis]
MNLIKEQNSKARTPWRSLFVVAALEFGYGFQLALYLAPIWPYLQVIDKTATDSFYGLIVMANALGQVVACPLFGYYSRSIGTIVKPIYLCLTLTMFGNLIFILAPIGLVLPKYVIFLSRFFIGTGEAVLTMTRSYTAMASLPQDRARAYGISAAGLAFGLLLGPVIQFTFTPLNYPGIKIYDRLWLNLYTIAPFLVLFYTTIELIVFKFVFKEVYPAIIKDENMREKIRCDKVAMGVMYFARFCQYFSFACAETISLRLLTIFGFIGLCFLPLASIPYPGYNSNIVMSVSVNSTTTSGCSSFLYSWCSNTKQINFWLFTVALVVTAGGVFNMMTVVLSTLFSKIIGPKPQTYQQSLFQTVACFARILAPPTISTLFTKYGPTSAWLFNMVPLITVLIVVSMAYQRLVPAQLELPYKKQTDKL